MNTFFRTSIVAAFCLALAWVSLPWFHNGRASDMEPRRLSFLINPVDAPPFWMLKEKKKRSMDPLISLRATLFVLMTSRAFLRFLVVVPFDLIRVPV